MSLENKIRTVVMQDGERMPMLISQNGTPHWYVTLFIVTQIRNAGKAPNTSSAVLSAVRILLGWEDATHTDIEARFARQKFLSEREIESIRTYAQMKAGSARPAEQTKVIKLSKYHEASRADLDTSDLRVNSQTHYVRLSYIADFLEWFATTVVEREMKVVDAVTKADIERMVKRIRLMRPQKVHRSRLSARRGLSEEGQAELLQMIGCNSNTNPFGDSVRTRNEMVILLFLHLGFRSGELLSLKVSDFDFQKNEVVIARRHGDREDPRSNQPVVKTMDRRLPLTGPLVKAVSDYVLNVRRHISSARRHEFLIVTHKHGKHLGQPLSKNGLAKFFSMIRCGSSEELAKLTPHVLRHTANDNFSKLMEKNPSISEAEEEMMRSYIFGWKSGSGTAATYNLRYVEAKACEAVLNLQNFFHRGAN